jgi:hypothetical protein
VLAVVDVYDGKMEECIQEAQVGEFKWDGTQLVKKIV